LRADGENASMIAPSIAVERLIADPLAASGAAATAEGLAPARKLELLEAVMLQCEQAEVPIEHVFAEGLYMRQGKILKGTFLIGHRHKTEHLNILFSGRVTVITDGVVSEATGPCVFKSPPGVRKLIYAHEDSIMANVHATTVTTPEEVEDALVIKSETHQLFHQGLQSDLMKLAEKLMADEPALELKGN